MDPPAALPAAPTHLLDGWGGGEESQALWGEGALPSPDELERAASECYLAGLDPLLAAAPSAAAAVPGRWAMARISLGSVRAGLAGQHAGGGACFQKSRA